MCCLSDGNVEVLRGQCHHVIAAAVVGVERRCQRERQSHRDHQRRHAPTDGAERHRQRCSQRGPRVSHFSDEQSSSKQL